MFDAVSALLGVCHTVTYEGEAAILLEDAQDMSVTDAYSCSFQTADDIIVLDCAALFMQCYKDLCAGVAVGVIARKFHLGLVAGCADMVQQVAAITGIEDVALSGGVMQSFTIGEALPKALVARGLNPVQHIQLPPNDGCISLGQAAYGRQWLKKYAGMPDD